MSIYKGTTRVGKIVKMIEPKISSLNDIANRLSELNTEAQNYFSSIINTYVPKFNTPVTLYTPNANCKNYFIRKRNDTYSIVWTNATAFVKKNSETLLYIYMSTISPYVTHTNHNYGIPIGKPSKDVSVTLFPQGTSVDILGYISQSFSSLEEAVVGIQSNSTTYTSNTSSAYTIEPVDNKYVFYTNAICALDSAHLVITMDTTFETNLDIISKNETIEVIE